MNKPVRKPARRNLISAPAPVITRPADDWETLPGLNGGIYHNGKNYEGYIRHACVRTDDCIIRLFGGQVEVAPYLQDSLPKTYYALTNGAGQRKGHDKIKETFSPVRAGSIKAVVFEGKDGKEWWSIVDGGNRVRRAWNDNHELVFADILDIPGMTEADLLYISNDPDTQKALVCYERYHSALESAEDNSAKDLQPVLDRAGVCVAPKAKGEESFGMLWTSLDRVWAMARGSKGEAKSVPLPDSVQD